MSWALVAASLLLLPLAQAKAEVENLQPAECVVDDFNQQVLRADDAESGSACVLVFLPVDEAFPDRAYESDALVRVDGSTIRLRRTAYHVTSSNHPTTPTLGDRHHYAFSSIDSTVRVTLHSEVVRSSCHVDTESCCGDNFEGELSVEEGGRVTVVGVTYYRGG